MSASCDHLSFRRPPAERIRCISDPDALDDVPSIPPPFIKPFLQSCTGNPFRLAKKNQKFSSNSPEKTSPLYKLREEESFFCRISPASWGLALPLESFITCPLRKFSAASLAGPEIRRGTRIRADDLVSKRLDRPRVTDLFKPSFLDDFGRRPAAGKHLGENLLALFGVDLSLLNQVHQFIERRGRDRTFSDGLVCRRESALEVVENPIGDALRLPGARRGGFEIARAVDRSLASTAAS